MKGITMRRPTRVLLALLLITITPARAQDGFGPEEQAALDEIRAALGQFVVASTYTADIEQKMDQDMVMTYQGRDVVIKQTVASLGTLEFEDTPDQEYDNRHLFLTQTVSTDIQGLGSDQEQVVGPIQTQMVVIDGQIFIKMDVPPELQAAVPSGWYDVTEGADAFPGMEVFDMQGMLKLGNVFGPTYLDDLIGAVLTVEILEPAAVDGRTVNTYRLTLDPPLALQGIGAANLEGMFNAEQSPFDIAGFIELLFTDEDTHYTVDFSIFADDRTLHNYTERMSIDVLIPSSLITDPSLQGAEMTLVQDYMQIMQPHDYGVPVSIQAPELEGSS
jgi:hypothetical protein